MFRAFRKWEYGFLSKEELESQFSAYSKAVSDPDSTEAENGYQHTEHLRHGLLWSISENKLSFTDQELEQLIELLKCDEDPIMARNFYSYLVNKNRVSPEQTHRFIELRTVANNT